MSKTTGQSVLDNDNDVKSLCIKFNSLPSNEMLIGFGQL